MSSNNTNNDNLDAVFAQKLQRGVETVRAWDTDPRNRACMAQIRASLPWDKLRDDTYCEPADRWLLDPNLRFVQRLARYFRHSMTWVNAPACGQCGNTVEDNMTQSEIRGPLSDDEVQGRATRVEVWVCNQCKATTTFPRYNLAARLFETKRGRCGEYANLFGLYCRAVGLEARHVVDWTDHVWTEVTDNTHNGQFVMVDSCEGVVNEPSMYEAGWGKQLNQIVSFGNYSAVDVTPRYTRQFGSTEFQARRRAITSSELAAEQILYQLNQSLWSSTTSNNSNKPLEPLPKDAQLSEKALAMLQRRVQTEVQELEGLKNVTDWDQVGVYEHGRISGSTAWKQARNEMGNTHAVENGGTDKGTPRKDSAAAWAVPESFYLRGGAKFSVSVHPQAATVDAAIQMNQTAAVALGLPKKHGHFISVAVFAVEEEALWQSRVIVSEQELVDYVSKLPSCVLVAMTGQLAKPDNENEEEKNLSLQRLGGFDATLLYPSSSDIEEKDRIADHLLFVGQVDACPSWTVCARARDYPNGYQVERTAGTTSSSNLVLAEYPNAVPKRIVGRLPNETMALAAQQTASLREKQAAFWNYQKDQDAHVTGFVTQSGASVYLLGETAYPVRQHGVLEKNGKPSSSSSAWTTSLLLPPALVPPELCVDEAALAAVATAEDENDKKNGFNYQVPVDLDFFHNHIGSELVTGGGGGATVPTSTALENCRLVGLYFSAHWCGPCRSFTPLLVEAYVTWKEAFATHGLEMIFVSSDRDPSSFASYHASMPWPAIGFDSLRQYKPLLSTIYGIRGIPSLVVLDAVSGQVVVHANASRNEVMQATRQGEAGLERLLQDWLNRVPASTLELLQMLEASCEDHTATETTDDNNDDAKYHISPYVSNDELPATVALSHPLPAGPHDSAFQPVASPSDPTAAKEAWEETCLKRLDVADRKTLLETCLKYVKNCRSSPSVVKFRNFRVSNNVVDRGMARIPHGLTLLQAAFGLQVSFVDEDYTISIPVGLDLDELVEDLSAYLEE